MSADKISVAIHPAAADGSGIFRTVIAVEVLSDRPLNDASLSDIAHEIVHGDASGRVEVLDHREIGKSDAAALLKDQGTEPEFLLGDKAWVYSLHPGDEVTWNDPDGGLTSRTLRIREIEFHGDVVRLSADDGWHAEVSVDELS